MKNEKKVFIVSEGVGREQEDDDDDGETSFTASNIKPENLLSFIDFDFHNTEKFCAPFFGVTESGWINDYFYEMLKVS